jgi:hypothetical protein
MRTEHLHGHHAFLLIFPLERDGPGQLAGPPANADPVRAAGSCRAPSQGPISDQDLRNSSAITWTSGDLQCGSAGVLFSAQSLPVCHRGHGRALLGYLQATRAHEWNGSNAANGDDPATTHAIASLENAVRTQAARPTLGTPASTELLASLDALTSDRRARLAAASHQLPALYVAVLLLTGVALIVNTTALTLRSGRRPALLLGGLAAVIGLSLALLFALGTPWRGPITVSGNPSMPSCET